MSLLKGIRVIELGTMITAPLAAMLLADLGADVIKVERPEGDPFRSFRGGLYSPHFAAYNRNKRSVTLNLQEAKGREALRKLIATADVLLDNFRPDVMPRLGLDPATLLAEFPKLISCSITGYGPAGPYSDRPAFDAVTSALSGLYSLVLDPEDPRTTGPTIIDNVTGLYACNGILAALHRRSTTGQGARIETNMLESAIAFIPDPFSNQAMLGIESGARTRVATSQSFAFRCSDGALLAVHLSSPAKFWESLAAATGRSDLLSDPRFIDRAGRVKNFEILEEELASTFAKKTQAEWAKLLEDADVPFAPVQSIKEVMRDPQVQHLATFYSAAHPSQGDVVGINPPIWTDGSREQPRAAPPTLGQHNDEVLLACGYTAADVAALKRDKIV